MVCRTVCKKTPPQSERCFFGKAFALRRHTDGGMIALSVSINSFSTGQTVFRSLPSISRANSESLSIHGVDPAVHVSLGKAPCSAGSVARCCAPVASRKKGSTAWIPCCHGTRWRLRLRFRLLGLGFVLVRQRIPFHYHQSELVPDSRYLLRGLALYCVSVLDHYRSRHYPLQSSLQQVV